MMMVQYRHEFSGVKTVCSISCFSGLASSFIPIARQLATNLCFAVMVSANRKLFMFSQCMHSKCIKEHPRILGYREYCVQLSACVNGWSSLFGAVSSEQN